MKRHPGIRNQKHACTPCHKTKVRCMVETMKEHNKCRRCYERGIECVFEVIAPRQRRKRTDTRLVSLEKEVADLKASLGQTSSTRSDLRESFEQHPHEANSKPNDETGLPTPTSPISSDDPIPGYLDASALSKSDTIMLFEEFKLYALPEYPIISLKHTDSFKELRLGNPTLLLAIVTAASRSKEPQLFEYLYAKLVKVLAERVVIGGERDLELMQAILIMEVWYSPPQDLKRLNFYMWINIVSTMALQGGFWWDLPGLDERDVMHSESQISLNAKWRMAFVVYLSMSTVSTSLRRPRIMDFSPKARSQLEVFSASVENENDHRFVAWVRLQLIAEEVEEARLQIASKRVLGTNSASGTALRQLEDRLASFRKSVSSTMTPSLQIQYFYCRMKLHEVAMTFYQNTDSTGGHQEGPEERIMQGDDTFVNSNFAKAALNLVQASHSVLDALFCLGTVDYLRCPTVTTVRSLYAIRELWALRINSVNVPANQVPFLDENTLSIDYYSQRLKEFLEKANEGKDYKVPTMALQTLTALRSQRDKLDKGCTDGFPRPERDVSVSKEDDLQQGTTPGLLSRNSNQRGMGGDIPFFENRVSGVQSGDGRDGLANVRLDEQYDLNLRGATSDFDLMTMPFEIPMLEDPNWFLAEVVP